MRKTLAKSLTETDYLLHADMWKFPTRARTINVGLGESNLLNVAAGLASQGEFVVVYGVSGFVIHRYEQLKFSCRNFGAQAGTIVICNAGAVGYEKFGEGHKLDDDLAIMSTLGIIAMQPQNATEFAMDLQYCKSARSGIYYIRLGRDE